MKTKFLKINNKNQKLEKIIVFTSMISIIVIVIIIILMKILVLLQKIKIKKEIRVSI